MMLATIGSKRKEHFQSIDENLGQSLMYCKPNKEFETGPEFSFGHQQCLH